MKNRRYKLIKSGIGIAIVASTLLTSGCSSSLLNKYYIVSDKGQNYICVMEEPKSNTHDYEYYDIKTNNSVGVMCAKRGGNFDYSIHRAGTKFLNEFQVMNLSDTLLDEGIDLGLFANENDINKRIDDKLLNDIVSNHFVRQKYYLDEKFKYIPNSKLQLFINENNVMIGYDVSPDRDFNKYRYIYSIEDYDVKEFASNDIVKAISIGIYLTKEQIKKGYISYNEAIDMLIHYKKDHYQKVKKIS